MHAFMLQLLILTVLLFKVNGWSYRPSNLNINSKPQNSKSAEFDLEKNIQVLDVGKLNELLHIIDPTWNKPKIGTSSLVGSNFQFQGTCESIYLSRTNACQQIVFGIMCFNYCFEKREKLEFPCNDRSGADYCKNGSQIESEFAKYAKQPNKLKTYIHQMISNCYATSVCNVQHGILSDAILWKATDLLLPSNSAWQSLSSQKSSDKSSLRTDRERAGIRTSVPIWLTLLPITRENNKKEVELPTTQSTAYQVNTTSDLLDVERQNAKQSASASFMSHRNRILQGRMRSWQTPTNFRSQTVNKHDQFAEIGNGVAIGTSRFQPRLWYQTKSRLDEVGI